MRRYDDVVEVRLAPDGPDHQDDQAPGQFVWRGRLYVVGAVLAQWVEVDAWWRLRDAEGLPVAAHATGRQVWRVEARAGRTSPAGVYDLTQDISTDVSTDVSTDRGSDLGTGPRTDDRADDRAGDRSSWSLVRAFD